MLARPDGEAAGHARETADLEGNAVRVGAHVPVPTVALDPLAFVSDDTATAATQELAPTGAIRVIDSDVNAGHLAAGLVLEEPVYRLGASHGGRYSTTRNSRKISTHTRYSDASMTQLEMTTSLPSNAADA